MRKGLHYWALSMLFLAWDGWKRVKRWWRNKFGGSHG